MRAESTGGAASAAMGREERVERLQSRGRSVPALTPSASGTSSLVMVAPHALMCTSSPPPAIP